MARMNGRCQMTSPIPGLDLDDCAWRHIDCRSKGCDMAFVMHLNN